MEIQSINKKLVTFCAVALLFLGSLFYLVSVAFKNKDTLTERQQKQDVNEYIKTIRP